MEDRIYYATFAMIEGKLTAVFDGDERFIIINEHDPIIEKAIKMAMKTPYKMDNIIYDRKKNNLVFKVTIKATSDNPADVKVGDIVGIAHPVCPFCGSEPENCGNNKIYVTCSNSECFMRGVAVNVADWRVRNDVCSFKLSRTK